MTQPSSHFKRHIQHIVIYMCVVEIYPVYDVIRRQIDWQTDITWLSCPRGLNRCLPSSPCLIIWLSSSNWRIIAHYTNYFLPSSLYFRPFYSYFTLSDILLLLASNVGHSMQHFQHHNMAGWQNRNLILSLDVECINAQVGIVRRVAGRLGGS